MERRREQEDKLKIQTYEFISDLGGQRVKTSVS
jgi:hypothetical protein